MSNILCAICDGLTIFTHRSRILDCYEADYYRCIDCEFWFVHEPTWLEEAYRESISRLDTGLVARNLRACRTLSSFIPATGEINFRGLDWSGGTGQLTRLMRDRGFNYFSTDLYTENVHARGFDFVEQDAIKLISLIEVLEHIESPLDFLKEIVERCEPNTVVFTQHLHENSNPPDWWYFMNGTGQHISFFSEKTLNEIANALGMKWGKYGDLYYFTRLDFSNSPKFIRSFLWISLINRIKSRISTKSLTWSDHIDLGKR